MSTQTPAALTQALFAHLGAGELTAASALFADTVDFAIPGAPDIPWIPEADSPAGMLRFFTLVGEHLDRKHFEVEKVLADDTDAVALGNLVSTVRATGRDIVLRFAIHLGVADGRISRYHLYEDSWAVSRAVAP